jgi:hypothetical protein
MTLNTDAVFMGEVLSVISGEQTGDWQKAYYSASCFDLPKSEQKIPLPLHYSAAANLFGTKINCEDKIAEKCGKLTAWKLGIRVSLSH